MNRQTFGTAVLAVSIVYSVLALTSWFHPMSLRMRAHGGAERIVALALGSLAFKGVLLAAGAILTFWPSEDTPRN